MSAKSYAWDELITLRSLAKALANLGTVGMAPRHRGLPLPLLGYADSPFASSEVGALSRGGMSRISVRLM